MDPSVRRVPETAEFREDRNVTVRHDCEVRLGCRLPAASSLLLMFFHGGTSTDRSTLKRERAARKRSWHIVTACALRRSFVDANRVNKNADSRRAETSDRSAGRGILVTLATSLHSSPIRCAPQWVIEPFSTAIS
jgi:hypothetical protein